MKFQFKNTNETVKQVDEKFLKTRKIWKRVTRELK